MSKFTIKMQKKHVATCMCLTLFVSSLCGMDSIDSLYNVQCKNLDLPILYITTVDSLMPTYEVAYPPEGCVGVGITNNEKVPARMHIVLHEETIYDTGDYKKDTSGVTIKIRGNTSAANTHEKKPYKLKLEKKKDLLFRCNDKTYADKEWVLLKNNHLYTMVGNMVNRAIGMEWTPAQTPVFVFLNGNFRGLYLLSENIKQNDKCRVNISKNGYLFEYDAYWWNEDFYIESSYRHNYTLKYPDADDILPEQIDYLTSHLEALENAYITPNAIDSAIDVHSYARWLWVHDMLGNSDGGGSNIFFAKYDSLTTSKQQLICAWDFDGCFTPNIEWSAIHNGNNWFRDFFTIPQSQFVNEYISIYDNQVISLFNTIPEEILDLRSSALTSVLDSAICMDNARWEFGQKSATIQLQELANWFGSRKIVIDSLMNELKTEYNNSPTAIPYIIEPETNSVTLYDILGRPVNKLGQEMLIIKRNSDGSVRKSIVK